MNIAGSRRARVLCSMCFLTACSSGEGRDAIALGAGGAPSTSSGGAPSTSSGGSTSGTGGLLAGAGGFVVGTGGSGTGNGTGGFVAGAGGATNTTGGNGPGGSSSAGGVAGGGNGGGAIGGSSGAGNGGASGAGGSAGSGNDCTSLPPVTDYTAPGPFADAKMFTKVGPNGNYTLYRPDASLGKNGFIHPVATWGNGILTTPDEYNKTLSLIASHGFVIIACNDTMAERPCLSAGMDWLVAQNTAEGPLKGKLDTNREVTIGYSWGGGAAIDTADRPNVKATVSLHGMPPRVTNAFDLMHAPLLLYTSTGDSFVTATQYVTPNYEKSKVQTFYATLTDSMAGHLYVVDEGSSICIGSIVGFGSCGSDLKERAPTIAWLRYWTCNDQNAKKFFYGSACTLCQSPWQDPQRKPMDKWQ